MSIIQNVLLETARNWRRRGKFIAAGRASDDPIRQERAEKALASLIEDITYETEPEILYQLIVNLIVIQDSELDTPDPRKKKKKK